MKQKCQNNQCLSLKTHPKSGLCIRNGFFYRKSDSKKIARFKCGACGKSISDAIRSKAYRQKKRRINTPLFKLLCSGVSMRRSAILLNVHRTTIKRKLRYLGEQSRLKQKEYLKGYAVKSGNKILKVQFDEMETFEHTKCKPLSVAMAVEEGTRKILGFRVSQMPAKGHLARVSIKKYGYRPDHRAEALESLFKDLRSVCSEQACFSSDQNPHYPKWVKKYFKEGIHLTSPGRKSAITGQGELKKVRFDPLFSFNHTAAMVRANVNRLFRKTWCTTKKIDALCDHLYLYVDYHNQKLTTP